MPAGPFSTTTRGFVVSGSSSRCLLHVVEGAAGIEVGEQRLERTGVRPQPRITRLRLRAHALEPGFHVIAIRLEQLDYELLRSPADLPPARSR